MQPVIGANGLWRSRNEKLRLWAGSTASHLVHSGERDWWSSACGTTSICTSWNTASATDYMSSASHTFTTGGTNWTKLYQLLIPLSYTFVVCFLLGNSPASELYKPTFRNALSHLHVWSTSYLPAYEDGTECSETSAYKIQTPGNYPEESIQH